MRLHQPTRPSRWATTLAQLALGAIGGLILMMLAGMAGVL